MLKLQGITKEYPLANEDKVLALKGVDLEFRKCEFVSVLGHSGCGKTTLLNIIGGLDRYTDGEMFINGTSTKQFKDKDWDAYRNHSVGFVFQTYNLIMHLSVLENVELALTLVGIDRKERHERAKAALASVGLAGQENKRPNQLSGGQMQRVAIARAIINDPEILLADEPTGALDTETSVQIMDILRSLANDRLIIMVTHNPELAEQYSTRIVRLTDGKVVDDSNPYHSDEAAEGAADGQTETAEAHTDDTAAAEITADNAAENEEDTGHYGGILAFLHRRRKRSGKGRDHTSMSYKSALALSGKNLLTKRARTTLTAIAGSIGIIGIAVVMALSSGFGTYVNTTAENTLSTYPLTISGSDMNLTNLMSTFMGTIMGDDGGEAYPEDDMIELNAVISTLLDIKNLNTILAKNDLESLKVYLDEKFNDDWGTLRYNYNLDMHMYTNFTETVVDPNSGATERFYYKVNPFAARVADQLSKVLQGDALDSIKDMITGLPLDDLLGQVETYSSMFAVWDELTQNQRLLDSQYEVVAGNWPTQPNEMVLVVDKYNNINDMVAFALGLANPNDATNVVAGALSGNNPLADWNTTAQTLIDTLHYQLMRESDYFQYDEEAGAWKFISYERLANDSSEEIKDLVDPERDTCVATTLNISGVVRLREGVTAGAINGAIAYRHDLVEWMIESAKDSDIITAQRASKDVYMRGKTIDQVQYRLASSNPDAPWNEGDFGSRVVATELYKDGQPTGEVVIAGTTDSEKAENRRWYEMLSKGGTGVERTLVYAVGVDGKEYGLENDKLRVYNRLVRGNDEVKYPQDTGLAEYEYKEWLTELGYLDVANPSSISIYSSNFDNKEKVVALLDDFVNWQQVDEHGTVVTEGSALQYSDMMGMLMSSITMIIQAITYVLIAFSSISLIVSSIMIAIITYTSVMERTKEIGVLRSIGARKKDISRVFNSETFIIGTISGIFAVLVAWILTFPANAILKHYTNIAGLVKILWWHPLLLIGLSIFLTAIAGFIPSRIAANKDPVAALRSE